mmetsp:Transcript_50732/g.99403  ORF Transcript_50732/g.99403 Transcript_50732/m.99403 type:complete len:162 (-) Transcript_50732:461-946(-)
MQRILLFPVRLKGPCLRGSAVAVHECPHLQRIRQSKIAQKATHKKMRWKETERGETVGSFEIGGFKNKRDNRKAHSILRKRFVQCIERPLLIVAQDTIQAVTVVAVTLNHSTPANAPQVGAQLHLKRGVTADNRANDFPEDGLHVVFGQIKSPVLAQIVQN